MTDVWAVVTNAPKGGVRYDHVSVEPPDDADLILKPLYTGICGTDRGIVSGSLPFSYNPQGYNFLVLGHESVCTVVESKNERFVKGDIVVPVVRRPGGCVNCRIGRPDNCSDGDKHEAGITGLHGFMRTEFAEKSEFVVPVKNKSIGRLAVLTEPLKNVVKAFEVFEIISKRSVYHKQDSTLTGKTCCVIGTGAEAFLYGLVAKNLGFNVILTNRHPVTDYKTKMLESFGLEFINYSEDFDRSFSSGIDLLIDTSGDPGTILKFTKRLNYNGIAILFGTNGRAKPSTITGIDIDYIVERNITLAGSVDAAKVHYYRALDYLEEWSFTIPEIGNMITGEYDPNNVKIFTQKGPGEIKSIIRWGNAP